MLPDRAKLDERARREGFEDWKSWKESLEDELGHTICGQPTVKTPVRPCSRPSGWGTEKRGVAEPCADHRDDAGAKRHAIKKEYLSLVAAGDYTLGDCAKAAGVARRTLDRWAQTDPDFEGKRRTAEVARARRRLENLSDSIYKDAIAGRTKGNERIYLMKVYAASLRRRGVEPDLDWDQPEGVEVSIVRDETPSPRERLERRIDAIRERLSHSYPPHEPQDDRTPLTNGN